MGMDVSSGPVFLSKKKKREWVAVIGFWTQDKLRTQFVIRLNRASCYSDSDHDTVLNSFNS